MYFFIFDENLRELIWMMIAKVNYILFLHKYLTVYFSQIFGLLQYSPFDLRVIAKVAEFKYVTWDKSKFNSVKI